jgi:hypothetical protein
VVLSQPVSRSIFRFAPALCCPESVVDLAAGNDDTPVSLKLTRVTVSMDACRVTVVVVRVRREEV